MKALTPCRLRRLSPSKAEKSAMRGHLAIAAVITLTALLVLQLQTSAGQQGQAKGSIEGIVVRSGTGEPIPDAQVTLTKVTPGATGLLTGAGQVFPPPSPPPPPPPPPAVVGGTVGRGAAEGGVVYYTFSTDGGGVTLSALLQALPPAKTDSNGRFAFKNLDAGTYRLSVASDGYARQDYGQRILYGSGTPVNLAAGQALKDVTVRLIPTGTVTGNIRDQAGRPVVGAPVQLLKPSFNAIGQRSFQSVGSARTDDRGEYRLYWITPGRYYLAAGSDPGPGSGPRGARGSPNEVQGDVFSLTYFPGVTDISQAAPVEVLPDQEVSAIGMVVARQQRRSVRGRVIDGRTGQPPASINIGLEYQNLTGGFGSFSSGQSYDRATGAFELRNVVPGLYAITASVVDYNPTDTGTRFVSAPRAAARVPVEVSNADVEGVILVLAPSGDIPGRVTVEGRSGSELPRTVISLRRSGTVNTPSTSSNLDGSFTIQNVTPGEYVVAVTVLQPGHYVKEIRYNQVDVLNQPLQFSASDSGLMTVVLSPDPGEVQGIVVDAKSQPTPGAVTVLVPQQNRDRPELYKSTTTDSTGRFTITGVAPGDYKLFAWEAIELFGYYDQDLLRRVETQGKAIRIAESSKETVEVKAIPVEP